jgi:GntR family transcriptional regulator, transcriptional repressor for pyruvate dehydrogenase complex
MIIPKTKKLTVEEIKLRAAKPAIQLNQRRSDEALRQILDLIFQGKLPPGARLPAERDLAELIGVSRNTLRDALNKLEARGYIERRDRSGAYVCTAIPQTLSAPLEEIVEKDVVGLRDIVDIRKALEIWAARKAAEAPRADLLKQLKNCVRAMRANAELRSDEQFARYSDADRRFHEVIAEMTGNPVYVHLFHYFTALLSRSMTITRELMQERFAEHNIKVHENVLTALSSGDPEAAERTMKEHFQFVEELIAPKPHLAAKASMSKPGPKLR